jgi:hypothetical protein
MGIIDWFRRHRRDARACAVPTPPPEPPAATTPPPTEDTAATTPRRRHVSRSVPEEWALSDPGDDGGLEAMLPPLDDGF